jgi:predicted nucleic acid-binding Zn ribbon protein
MANLKKTDRREPIEHFHCLICGETIDPDRAIRKAVTCSEQHAHILTLERRRLARLRTVNRCYYCNRPSTPAERAEFAAWRKAQAKEKGIKPGPKPKPAPGETPLEQHLGTIAVQ